MIVLLIILAVIAVGAYMIYAGLIAKRNKAQEALSGIDVQLTKRHDLIPNILTIAKRFMEHEKELLEGITALRQQAVEINAKASADEASRAFEIEKQLQTKMGQFMVQVEAYPELKSDTQMLEAQRAYTEVEANIAASRRFYNSAVGDLKNAVEIFPSSMIAGMINITAMPFFEADEAARAPVNAADHL